MKKVIDEPKEMTKLFNLEAKIYSNYQVDNFNFF